MSESADRPLATASLLPESAPSALQSQSALGVQPDSTAIYRTLVELLQMSTNFHLDSKQTKYTRKFNNYFNFLNVLIPVR